jgi:hypothetical protein
MNLNVITLDKAVNPQAKHVERGQEWLKKAVELMKIKQLLKEYEAIEGQLLAELKILSDNVPSRCDNFVFDCIPRKGLVDYSKIPELKGVDLELYRKEPTVAWKLSMQIDLTERNVS